jgi:Tfp pilus assembly protein PilP
MSRRSNKLTKFCLLGLVLIAGVFWWGMAISTAGAEEAALVSTGTTILKTPGKIDPFKPFIETGSDVMKEKKVKGALPLSPLQRQDLSAFKLVGIAGNGQDGWKAIVEDNEKKFYPIIEGTLIGFDQGRVSSIKSDRVIVAVQSADQKGKTNYITIMLHKDIEETP